MEHGAKAAPASLRAMRPVELVMVGAGNRGHLAYGAFAERNPEVVKFVAVVEPDDALGEESRNYAVHRAALAVTFAKQDAKQEDDVACAGCGLRWSL